MSFDHATISLFIPCLIDQAFPDMGFAMVRVLRKLGFTVQYDPAQTCCGQPAFNAGFHDAARHVARHCLHVFASKQTLVCPSGSCTAMVRQFYPELFAGQPEEPEARTLGSKVWEFSAFLSHALAGKNLEGKFSGRVSFHNSCHSFRELQLEHEVPNLIRQIDGCELLLPQREPVCCGFGGLFSVKFAPIAETMAKSRLEVYAELGIDVLISNDPGCIMHLRQEAGRLGMPFEILHLAEFLDRVL